MPQSKKNSNEKLNPDRETDSWEMTPARCKRFRNFVAKQKGGYALARAMIALPGVNCSEESARRYIQRHKKTGALMHSDHLTRYALAAKPPLTFEELHAWIIDLKKPKQDTSAVKADQPLPLLPIVPPPQRQEFKEFFGPSFVDDEKQVQIYFPKRMLRKDLETDDEPPFFNESQCQFELNGKKRMDVWPEGLSGFLAYESVIAAIQLSTFITQTTGKGVWVRQENSRALSEGIGACVISFGLGFSAVTRVAEKHFHPPLFTVYCDQSPKKNFRKNCRHRLTDNFRLYRETTNSGGDVSATSANIDIPSGKDIGLLVRLIPTVGTSKKPQPWFICAGRTGTGTTATAYFLANKWEQLFNIYKATGKSLQKDSLAVVIIHDEPDELPRDMSTGLGISPAERAELHYWDEEKKHLCAAFGMWSRE